MHNYAAPLVAAAVAISTGCLAKKREPLPRQQRTQVEPIPVEGRFDRDLAYFPCDLLTPKMVSAMSGIPEPDLQRYELGETCAYVWNDDGQAAIRRLVVEDTINEAEDRQRGVRALDGCEPIDEVGDEACVRTVIEQPGRHGEDHEIRVAVRVSNARFSIVWAEPEPVLGRLHAVALARKVVAALPDEDGEAAIEPEPQPELQPEPQPPSEPSPAERID